MSTEDAVRKGIAGSAGTVTSAAVVMVVVFSVFATLSFIDFKEMGVGLAVAILIDATIIRGRPAPGDDEAARRLELVPAAVARVAAADGREPRADERRSSPRRASPPAPRPARQQAEVRRAPSGARRRFGQTDNNDSKERVVKMEQSTELGADGAGRRRR